MIHDRYLPICLYITPEYQIKTIPVCSIWVPLNLFQFVDIERSLRLSSRVRDATMCVCQHAGMRDVCVDMSALHQNG
jgi:hypothetical protein